MVRENPIFITAQERRGERRHKGGEREETRKERGDKEGERREGIWLRIQVS